MNFKTSLLCNSAQKKESLKDSYLAKLTIRVITKTNIPTKAKKAITPGIQAYFIPCFIPLATFLTAPSTFSAISTCLSSA